MCLFDDTVSPTEDFDTDEWLRRLEDALVHGDIHLTDEIGSLLLSIIHANKHRMEVSLLTHEMLNAAQSALRRLQYPASLFYSVIPGTVSDSRLLTAEETQSALHALAAEINLRQQNSGTEDQRMRRILQLIEENYTDPAFSTKVIANEMSMSVSNLSHYFKKQSGHVISEHISNLRFAKAKLLLCTTNLPLNSIIHQSGYYHVATLIRQFKQIEGMTPTEYRSMVGERK